MPHQVNYSIYSYSASTFSSFPFLHSHFPLWICYHLSLSAPFCFLYTRHSVTMIHEIRIVVSMYLIYSCIHYQDDLLGVYDKAHLFDNDLPDPTFFPPLWNNVFMDPNTHPNVHSNMKVRPVFCPLKQSTLLVLRESLVGTIGEVMCCTNFPIIRLHGGSLRLDCQYTIHVVDIYKIT